VVGAGWVWQSGSDSKSEGADVIGAIIGDVIGSVHEHTATKTTKFPLFRAASRFTDDTVLTIATADALLGDGDYGRAYREWACRYPGRGYGKSFRAWLLSPKRRPYGSFGNGSAMRVSPIGFAFDTEKELLREAKRSAVVTHDHREGIKGAQAVALTVFLARSGATKKDIRQEIARRFRYDLSRTLNQIRPAYGFDVTCQGSVPESIIAFLESKDLEGAVRGAISLGGDADTMAAIAGAAAGAWGERIPLRMERETRKRITPEMLGILLRLERTYLG
jgi:ADP-ribosylglycohydrolase